MIGQLFIVSAPSGAGKTTLTRLLLANDPGIRLSISHTTRAPRPSEENGREYHFVATAEFEKLRESGEFLESAHVHGNYYGTSRRWIVEQRAAGHDVLLEIDWQGAQQVRRIFSDAIGVFVLPPSIDELRRRLVGRGQDSEAVIARRVAAAEAEMRHVGEFGYVIINADLQTALADLLAVVRAARVALPVQRERHPELFAALISSP